MTSSSELVINDKLDFRYEAEVYSASVSAPMVPAVPKWMPARWPNPFVKACQAAGSPGGRFCLAKPVARLRVVRRARALNTSRSI